MSRPTISRATGSPCVTFCNIERNNFNVYHQNVVRNNINVFFLTIRVIMCSNLNSSQSAILCGTNWTCVISDVLRENLKPFFEVISVFLGHCNGYDWPTFDTFVREPGKLGRVYEVEVYW